MRQTFGLPKYGGSAPAAAISGDGAPAEILFKILQSRPSGAHVPPSTTCTISQVTHHQNGRQMSVTSVISASRYRP
jgi:hypothetical protein